MKWNKSVRANKWADMISDHIKNLEERKTVTKWNWLVFQISISAFFLILIWKM